MKSLMACTNLICCQVSASARSIFSEKYGKSPKYVPSTHSSISTASSPYASSYWLLSYWVPWKPSHGWGVGGHGWGVRGHDYRVCACVWHVCQIFINAGSYEL